MPDEFAPGHLLRRLGVVVALLAILVLVALLAPGLGEVRERLDGADAGWLIVAVVLEALSCASYVLMFRPVFCSRMSVRTSTEIALSELAVGSIVPHERSERARVRRLDPAPPGDAGRAHRAPLRRVPGSRARSTSSPSR